MKKVRLAAHVSEWVHSCKDTCEILSGGMGV